MEEITWISFDDTVPVPVLASRFALERESVRTLFEKSNGGENEIRWEKDGAWIQWLGSDPDGWDYDEAEHLTRIEVEGVEFFKFDSAPYQFNFDTEIMEELGYSAFFVPGGGIVVNTPDTPPAVAAGRIIAGLESTFGKFTPQRLNSWAEYVKASSPMDRIFTFAGVDPHEKEKQAVVGDIVHRFLANRAAGLPVAGTARADGLQVGDELEAEDVRWGSWSPVREVFTVQAIRAEDDGMLAVTVREVHGFERTLSVLPERRFLKATNG